MSDWYSCEHEWRDVPEDDSELQAVICKTCGCPGEREPDGQVFWPAT
jgi:hypothetical protein